LHSPQLLTNFHLRRNEVVPRTDKVVADLGKVEKTCVNLKSAPDDVAWAECVQAKLPASSMNHSLGPEGTKIGELVFSDICGEMPVLGYCKSAYLHLRRHLYCLFRTRAATPVF
jgi:hypothetical protein